MKLSKLCAFSVAVFASGLLWSEPVDTALFQHAITVKFSGCSAVTPIANFPVCVKLAQGVPFGFSYADCSVDSFRFTDVAGNVLPHDVETWDPEGTSYIWVSVPSLAKDEVIMFRYGAASASLPANTPSEVWTRADYAGVWHMAEASGNIADSAGNNLTASHKGTVPNPPAVAGVIGNARCTATSAGRGYLSIPSYDSLSLGGTFTISGWLKESAPNGYSRIFSRKVYYKDDNGWEIEMSNGSKTSFTARAAQNDQRVAGSLPDLTTDWRLLAFAYDNATLTVFGDGAQVAQGSVSSVSPDNGNPLSIGCDSDGNEAHVLGSFDEVRLRRVASTAEWMAMEYESARTESFAVLSPVDQEIQNSISASAEEGGLVRIDDGDAAASVQSAGVDLGQSLTAVLTATASEGYHFHSWSGNLDKIVVGDRFSSSVTVTTTVGASLVAKFISTSGAGFIEIVNAFEHPSGGFMSADYKKVPGSVFSNLTDCVVAFRAPDQAPAGLREFCHGSPSKTDQTDDWGFFKDFVVGTLVTTQDGVRYATSEKAVDSDNYTCTYAGSWYVPANGTYSFRMNMKGNGELVIDNTIIVQQKSAASVVTKRDVALTAGWHNLFIVLQPKNKVIGPVDTTTPGLLYSAANADLAVDPTQGSAFATEEGENAHRLSTAYSGVLVPSFWAAGGDVVIDCANTLGDLRVAGQLGSLNHTFTFANLPAGRVVEVGRPANYEQNGYQDLNSFAYVDWSRTRLSAGVNVRFEGAVAFDKELPAGHTWSLGRRVTLATTLPDLFGVVASDATDFTYPSGLLQLYLGNTSVLGDKVTIHVGTGQGLGFPGGPYYYSNNKGLPYRCGTTAFTFKNPIDVAKSSAMNMTPVWDSSSICGGTVTGQGDMRITGWGRRMIVKNAIDVGTVVAGQRANRIMLQPVAGAVASRIGTANLSGEATAQPGGGWNYCGATLFYCPGGEGQPPLSIGTVYGNGASFFSTQTTFRRNGATLSVCSNNTVNVSSLKGSGIHLRTVVPASAGTDPVESSTGNIVIGSIDAATTVYISTNVNVTVTNVTKTVAFKYDPNDAGVANGGVLDIEGTCTAESTLSAPDIAALPARVKNFTGTVTLTETEEKTYPVTLDFSKAAPVLGGCDGSGTLAAAPSAGTITVTFAGESPISGNYGLARFTTGGSLLANWTVSAPKAYNGYVVESVKDETGLWLKVRKGGTLLLLR